MRALGLLCGMVGLLAVLLLVAVEPERAQAACPTGQYSAEYFNNQTLAGSPTLTACEGSINYDWGYGGPGGGVAEDHFSARWTGRFNFVAGDYTFIATADDGIRVFVDGSLVINAWIDQSPTEYRVNRSLTAGEHEVKVEFYENDITAVTKVSWATGQPPPPPPPAGSFQESVVFSGLTNPTVVQFSPDGRVFVGEKSGLIKVFDNISDTTPTIFADLRTNVYNFWDRGLLGLALDPNFPTNPYVYVLYAYDAAIGGTAPRWGSPGATSDPCPTPPGATADGCVVSGRLSRLQANGNVMTGSEQVLIEDWCQQYPSHSVGTLAFGADGALYVSGGDGASFSFIDYGQDGNPLNPCGDPPSGVGGTQTPPTAEGGALRSQDLRTLSDPTSLDGAILRVNPSTGAALPDNPLFSNSNLNARRIIAYGMRNPFRMTIRPGTNEVWLGDVGMDTWEEINRFNVATDGVKNFGWPCYEGDGRQPGYDSANLNICENLYGQSGAATAPFYTYNHSAQVVNGETCGTGNSSVTGVAFYNGGPYPASYDNALFFADYSRNCIWVMFPGAGGLPDPAARATFVPGAVSPVDLKIGPGGDLFYVDLVGGTIRRIQYFGGNQPPTAVAQASPLSGPVPLAVNFDGTGSSDPDPGDTLTYAWDLDGNGTYGDSTLAKPAKTYTQGGTYAVRLKVTDSQGASAISAPVVITAGNTPPTAAIANPNPATLWKVGDVIPFSGSATDAEDGPLPLPPSAFLWSLIMHHCAPQDPTQCHTHNVQDFAGVSSGQFVAPDHEWPAYIELKLVVTDSGGLTATKSVLLYPQTVALTFASSPSGLQLAVGGGAAAAPFSLTMIVGSGNSVSASSPQTLGGQTYQFVSWSDGGAASHIITAPATPQTYTATYTPVQAACPTGQYFAEYFNNQTLAGSPTFTACEGSINYDWGYGGPGGGVSADHFSARWTGRFNFAAGDYTFIATADDGIRVFVDGSLVINAWIDQGPTEYRANRSLSGGEHEIKVEFYENDITAVTQVRWESGQPPPPAPTCVAPTITSSSDTNPTGGGTVSITWNPVPGATQYRVQRQTTSGGWSTRQTSGVTSFTGSDSSSDPSWRVFVYAGTCTPIPGPARVFDP